jgi:ParG
MSKLSTLSAGRPSIGKSKEVSLSSLSNAAPLKRVNFQLSIIQHQKLKIFSAKQGKSIKDLLTDYVDSLPEQ